VTQALRIERIDAGHVRIGGSLGFAEVVAALARGGELIAGVSRAVTVDASALEKVDSATLALLLAWVAHARERGIALRFPVVPDGLRALARLCDTEPLLGIA
jgi:phospholipid transport system transporter-binding protein